MIKDEIMEVGGKYLLVFISLQFKRKLSTIRTQFYL